MILNCFVETKKLEIGLPFNECNLMMEADETTLRQCLVEDMR